jgi:hypothetical protein
VANRLRAVALVAVVAVVVASCGIPTDAAPHAIPKSDVPFHLLSPPSPSTTTTLPPAVAVPVDIFLVDPTQHVAAVLRDVALPATMTEIMGALLDGPTASESTAGIQSFLSAKASQVSATVAGGVATVDFDTNPVQVVGPDQVLAVAQVVFTATDQPGVTGVLFEIDGSPVSVPIAGGVQVPGPVSRAQYAAQAPVAPAP